MPWEGAKVKVGQRSVLSFEGKDLASKAAKRSLKKFSFLWRQFRRHCVTKKRSAVGRCENLGGNKKWVAF